MATTSSLHKCECGPELYLSTVDSGSTGVGFFTRPDYLEQYRTGSNRVCGGVFFAGRDGWSQLGVQVLGATVITAFTAACRWASGWMSAPLEGMPYQGRV